MNNHGRLRKVVQDDMPNIAGQDPPDTASCHFGALSFAFQHVEVGNLARTALSMCSSSGLGADADFCRPGLPGVGEAFEIRGTLGSEVLDFERIAGEVIEFP